MRRPKHSDKVIHSTEPTNVALMRALVAAISEIFAPATGYGSAAYRAQLARDAETDRAEEVAIRRTYPNALFAWNDLERRAAAHGVRFSSFAQAHHRAAILDFLDDPSRPTDLNFRHATWFWAHGADGRRDTSMAHPVNQAAFQIAYRDHQRRGIASDWYTAERAAWDTRAWQRHEAEQQRHFETVLLPKYQRHWRVAQPQP